MAQRPSPFHSRGFRDDDRAYSRDDREPVSLEAKCVRATDKALLCVTNDGKEQWFPKSVVHDDSEVYAKGHEGVLIVQAWFAEKEGVTGRAWTGRLKAQKPTGATSPEALVWLETLKAHQKGKKARPCKALVELEHRGLAKRSGGPGSETLWMAVA